MKTHLKLWRKVKKNESLKVAPTFWKLASTRRQLLPLSLTKSLRVRNMLDAHAACGNLFTKNCVLDVSQTVDRVALRSNGEMLTLTRTCGHIFSPFVGTTLSPGQCFALQGDVLSHCTLQFIWSPTYFEQYVEFIVSHWCMARFSH